MLTMERPTSVMPVDREVGRRIKERRTRLGMHVIDLAERAGIDRGRLAEIEKGKAANTRDTTIARIERALDALEHEMSIDVDLPPGVRRVGDPAEGIVEFTVEGNFGVRAVVKGPISDLDQLQEAVAKLIAGMKSETD